MRPELIERLDPVCDRFEADWLACRRPCLEEFLLQVEEPERHALLEELLALDLEYRFNHGERPAAEEYLLRLPEFATVIHRAFGLSSTDADTPAIPTASRLETLDVADPTMVLKGGPVLRAGRYHIEEEIARGGMGVVWRARDPELGRSLAVKILLEQHSDQSDLKRRFREEAQITSQLQHPGVPPVHEVGTLDDGRPFFAMKLIEGRTLAELLRERTTPAEDLPRFVSIFEQVCQTMAYAHSRRVIHRDLKPSNVMVGAFGEVQVMDWGLAKILDDRRPASAEVAVVASTIATLQSHSAGLSSQPGMVLGTPAFMAPEQARGEVERLDERCDVFGLGAILCVILTGQPPYQGASWGVIHAHAAMGDLGDILTRLETCGADAALVELAKSCLTPHKEGRPAEAGMVAAAVARYQAALRQRLRQAEFDVAEARTRAAEEQKRLKVERQKRRLTVALAVAVVLLVLVGSGTTLWLQKDRAERERRHDVREQTIRDTLEQANKVPDALKAQLAKPGGVFQLLNNPAEWKEQIASARAVLKRAEDLASESEWPIADRLRQDLQAVEERLAGNEADFALAQQLEQIRYNKANLVNGGKLDHPGAMRAYARFFEAAPFAASVGNLAVLVEPIKKSAVKEQLLVALEDWALSARVLGDKALMRQLLPVIRDLDTDPWTRRLWDEKVWEDTQTRITLVNTMRREALSEGVARKLSPQALFLVGVLLENTPGEAEAWLRQAQALHPTDFWLNFQLGSVLYQQRPEEGVASYRIALALRPQSSAVHYRIALHMRATRNYDFAIRHLKQVLQLDPENVLAHYNLGNVLMDKKQTDDAIEQFKQALAIDPNHFFSHHELGKALRVKKDFKGAHEHLNRALKIQSGHFVVLLDLGDVFRDQKDLPEAISHYRKSLKAVPTNADGLSRLGAALMEQEAFVEARQALQTALQIIPEDDPQRGSIQDLLNQCLKRLQ